MKKNKLLVVIGVAVLIGLVSLMAYKSQNHSASDDVIRIGAILPLTGNIAYFGEPERNAIELFKEIEPNIRLDVYYEDSRNDPGKAVSAYNKLYNLNGVKCFISQMTGVNLALTPLAEKNKTFLFSLAMDPIIAQRSRYVIRCYEDVADESYAVWHDVSKKWDISKVKMAIGYLDDPWGLYARDAFVKASNNQSGVVYVPFAADTKVNDVVPKLMEDSPNVIFIIGYGPIVANIVRSLKESKCQAQIYGNIGMSWDYILRMAGSAIEGCLIAMPSFDPYDLSVDFTKRYREKYGILPNFEAAYTYDAISLMVTFLKSRQDTFTIKEYSGICGDYKFDDDGNSRMTNVAIRKVTDGKLKTDSIYSKQE